MRRVTSMPSQQFRHALAYELERLQTIHTCTEHGILYSYLTTRDWYKKSIAKENQQGFFKRFLSMKIA